MHMYRLTSAFVSHVYSSDQQLPLALWIWPRKNPSHESWSCPPNLDVAGSACETARTWPHLPHQCFGTEQYQVLQNKKAMLVRFPQTRLSAVRTTGPWTNFKLQACIAGSTLVNHLVMNSTRIEQMRWIWAHLHPGWSRMQLSQSFHDMGHKLPACSR